MSRSRSMPPPILLCLFLRGMRAALAGLIGVVLLVSACAKAPYAASTPSLADSGTLYFGADGVYALRARDGTVRWHTIFDPQGDGNGVPALADGTLYVPLLDAPNDLAALDAQTGQVRWRVRVPLVAPDEGLAGQLTVADGVLYIGTSRPHGSRPSPAEGAVYALDARDGTVRWRASIGESLASVPVVADGVVYVVVGTDMAALRARDGRLLWHEAFGTITGNLLGRTPAVVDGVIYVGTGRTMKSSARNPGQEDALAAFRASDGHLLWRVPTDGLVGDTPTVVDGVIYVTTAMQTVYALDVREGTLRWHFTMEHLPPDTPAASYSPKVADGVVYVGALGGGVFALSAGDGTRRWLALPLPRGAGESEAIVQTLLVAGETIYVGTRPFPHPDFDQSYDGVVYALKAIDGTRLWTYHSEKAPPFSPLLLSL